MIVVPHFVAAVALGLMSRDGSILTQSIANQERLDVWWSASLQREIMNRVIAGIGASRTKR
jgi:hypothetical protein